MPTSRRPDRQRPSEPGPPIPPAPTWTNAQGGGHADTSSSTGRRRTGRGSAGRRSTRRGSYRRSVGSSRSRSGRPLGTVRDHPTDVGVVVHGEVLVAGGEVEDLPEAAAVRHTAPEDLAAGEPEMMISLVRGRDVEVLAVHLLLGMTSGSGRRAVIGCLRVDGPRAPGRARCANRSVQRGCHELAEDLRPVAGVQDDEAHAGQDVLVDAVDHGRRRRRRARRGPTR